MVSSSGYVKIRRGKTTSMVNENTHKYINTVHSTIKSLHTKKDATSDKLEQVKVTSLVELALVAGSINYQL